VVLTILDSAKYSKGDDRSLLDAFFQEHAQVISKDVELQILKIVENVSYSKEVKRIAGGLQTPWHESCLELHWFVYGSSFHLGDVYLILDSQRPGC